MLITGMDYFSASNLAGNCVRIDKNGYNFTVDLMEGKYYVGYFNNKKTENFNISFVRIVAQSGSAMLVLDPHFANCGCQINIIEMNEPIKCFRQTFITWHFTRLIYPDCNYGVPASRLEYYWYSSNEQIATVSQYRTVLGKNLGMVICRFVFQLQRFCFPTTILK